MVEWEFPRSLDASVVSSRCYLLRKACLGVKLLRGERSAAFIRVLKSLNEELRRSASFEALIRHERRVHFSHAGFAF